MKTRLDIILPVYKEQDNIEKVLDGIKKYVKTPHTINLVFYSPDDPTIPIAEKIRKSYKNLYLFKTYPGKGLASQYKFGFKKTTSPLILIMMSDLSDNPRDVDKMIKKIDDGYDLVCASRYIKNGERRGGSKLKAMLSFLGCESIYFFTGLRSHDATNAFKCFKREVLSKIKIESEVGYELPLEIFIKAHFAGFKIAEIPTVWIERDKGYSKFKLFKYVPKYLRWYKYAMTQNITKIFG